MQLVLEIRDPRQREWVKTPSKRFAEHGGVVGRHQACDWVLADPQCHVSRQHVLISHEHGRFLLTDTSRNGTYDGLTGERLPKGVAHPVEQGSCWLFGRLRIHARLESTPHSLDVPVGEPAAAGSVIPDNAFLGLGPLEALLEDEPDLLGSLLATQTSCLPMPPSALDGAGIDTENLTVPRLIAEAPAVAGLPAVAPTGTPDDAFWQAFAAALGVSFDDLPTAEREQVALSVATLLRHSLEGAGLLALLRRQGLSGQPGTRQMEHDFARPHTEQVRLTSALQTPLQG